MTTYTIHIDVCDGVYDPGRYHATFDGYCGAPDSDCPIGLGYSHREAIYKLLESHYTKLEDE